MRHWAGVLTTVAFATLCVPARAGAQAPDLGAAKSFAVLGSSTVTNVGATVITGNLGLSPGTSVTGFPPGQVLAGSINIANGPAAAARASVAAAYNDLVALPTTQDLTGQDLGGLTLTAGVYNFAASAQLTGILTLDAQGNSGAVFIFKIGSTLTTATGATVVVINGGTACNVFWQVGSSATLGTSTQFAGNILAEVSITLSTGANVVGRVLAQNGAVTLDTNAVDASSCNPLACGVLTLAPATLPGGVVGTAYSQTITTSGGSGSYTYDVESGSLPPGLSLSTAGVLSGTPTTAGPFTVTVRSTDGSGCPGVVTYAIVIAVASCPAITLAPVTLPGGTVGAIYSQTITASGGAAPYRYTVQSGALPLGLTLSTAGVLSGTPTAAGPVTVTVRATDNNGCLGVVTYAMVISSAGCPVITLAPATLPDGTIGVAYSQLMTASGGAGAYTYAVQSGTLPSGLTLSTAGLISGTPSSAATSVMTIQGTDGSACIGVVALTLVVPAAVPTLPDVFVVLLAVGLSGAGIVRLRRRVPMCCFEHPRGRR